MTQLVVTWSVLAGLLGPVPVHDQAPPGALAPAPTDTAALYVESGPPLWSYCRPELTAGAAAGRGGHSRSAPAATGTASPGPEVAEADLAETGVAETPVPEHWLPCVPWGPGLSGGPVSGMGSNGDDEEAPICVEGAECSPVSPRHAPYTASFSASKAVLAIATLAPCAPTRRGRVCGTVGRAALGFPEIPFEPPRRLPLA